MIRGLPSCSIPRFKQPNDKWGTPCAILASHREQLCILEPLIGPSYLRPSPMLTANIYLKLFWFALILLALN